MMMCRVFSFLYVVLFFSLISSCSGHMYSTSLGIHQLTLQNFDMIIQRPNQAFIVQFFNKNDESKELFREYVKLPNMAEKQIQVGVVDGTDPQNKELLTRYKITSFPSIKLFIGHHNATEAAKIARIKPIDYVDRKKTAQSILNFAWEQIPNVPLWTAKDEAKVVAEGSSLPRALLFTDKKESLQHRLYKSAALTLGSRMKFVEIRKNERKLFDKYDIGSQLPVLLVVPATGGKGASTKKADPIQGETLRQKEVRDTEIQQEDVGDETDESHPIIYDHPWNYSALLTFLSKYAAPDVVIQASGEANTATGPGWDPSTARTEAAPRTPGDDLGYLSDQSCLRAYCLDTNTLCAIMIANENNEHIDEWKTKFRTLELGVKSTIAQMFRFVWMDGEAQTYFLQTAFGLVPQDYPQVVVLAGRKSRWVPYVGAFDATGITEFLDGILHGKIRTQALKSPALPTLQGDSERCPPGKPVESVPESTPDTTTTTTPIRDDLPLPLPQGEAGVVLQITGEDVWENHVKKSKQAWMIAFTASWNDESKALLPDWMSVGRRLRNMVRFGHVECGATDNPVCQRFGVTEFPSIKTFDANTDKHVSVAVEYTGERTADALYATASKLIKPSGIRKVNSESLVQWISENPSVVRVLLFQTEEKLPEYFQALSQHFKGFINFGAAKHTDHSLIQQFQVKEMPSLYILKIRRDKGEDRLEATYYNGPISFSGLASFLHRVLELGGNMPEGSTPMNDGARRTAESTSSSSSSSSSKTTETNTETTKKESKTKSKATPKKQEQPKAKAKAKAKKAQDEL